MDKLPGVDPDAGIGFSIHDDDATRRISRLEGQKWWIRGTAIVISISVIVAAVILEWWLLPQILLLDQPPDFAFILAIAPIFAITTIVVFILLGAFLERRQDMSVPRHVLEAVSKSATHENA